MAAIAETPAKASPRKRKVPDAIDGGEAASQAKRARRQSSPKSNEKDERMGTELDGDYVDFQQDSLSPSNQHIELSVADTTASGTKKRPKRYKCDHPDCGKAFDRPIRLQVHARSHTNERPFVCEIAGCDKTFQRNEHLTRHVNDKHGNPEANICGYVVRVSDDGEEVKCGKGFTTAARLKRHEAVHEKKEETKCQEPGCGQVFRKQETLQRHIKTEHLGEKAFRCSHVEIDDEGVETWCGQEFLRPAQLRKHIAREHSGDRYFCDICSPPMPSSEDMDDAVDTRVGFPTYTDLQDHLRTVHPPTCTLCGIACETNRALRAHLEIEHSTLSERQNYKCTWPGCDRGFTKAGNLKVHVQNVHTKARNFVCGGFDLSENPKVQGWNGQGCGSAFGTKANLEEHVRTQHLGLPSKIRPCRRRKAEARGGSSGTPSTMDVDELETPSSEVGPRYGGALSLLTGYGYEESRPIPCLIHGCLNRFGKEYELASHLELTHGWQVDDVNERLAERRALEGGPFWVGRVEEPVEADGQAEESLRLRLEEVLRPASAEQAQLGPSRETGVDFDQVQKPVGVEGIAVDGTMGEDGQATMMLDPVLTGQ